MESAHREKHIGAYWIAAMITLLALLMLGTVLYLRMSVPVEDTGLRTSVRYSDRHSESVSLTTRGEMREIV